MFNLELFEDYRNKNLDLIGYTQVTVDNKSRLYLPAQLLKGEFNTSVDRILFLRNLDNADFRCYVINNKEGLDRKLLELSNKDDELSDELRETNDFLELHMVGYLAFEDKTRRLDLGKLYLDANYFTSGITLSLTGRGNYFEINKF